MTRALWQAHTVSLASLAAISAPLLLVACSDAENTTSAAGSGAENAVILARCYDAGNLDIVERPTTVVFGCDGTGTLQQVTWTSWSAGGADGSGTVRQTLCDPSCAEGIQTEYRVIVHAQDVQQSPPQCGVDFRYFSTLIVAYPDATPELTDTIYQDMPAIEYDTTPICAA